MEGEPRRIAKKESQEKMCVCVCVCLRKAGKRHRAVTKKNIYIYKESRVEACQREGEKMGV